MSSEQCRSRESVFMPLTGIRRGDLLKYTADMQVTVGGSLTGMKGNVIGPKSMCRENVSACQKLSLCLVWTLSTADVLKKQDK